MTRNVTFVEMKGICLQASLQFLFGLNFLRNRRSGHEQVTCSFASMRLLCLQVNLQGFSVRQQKHNLSAINETCLPGACSFHQRRLIVSKILIIKFLTNPNLNLKCVETKIYEKNADKYQLKCFLIFFKTVLLKITPNLFLILNGNIQSS